MIVRIATEGQYELEESSTTELDALDREAVAVCETGDEVGFRDVYERLLEFVRTRGRRIDSDELLGSDLILPPPDVTVQEARAEFSGEGLLPS